MREIIVLVIVVAASAITALALVRGTYGDSYVNKEVQGTETKSVRQVDDSE